MLIVDATGPSEKWTLAIFDDVRFDEARELRAIIIDDPSHALSEELKKNTNKGCIKELVAQSLDRTLFVEEKEKIKTAERKDDLCTSSKGKIEAESTYTVKTAEKKQDISTILKGKIETESTYTVSCNIAKKCWNEKNCQQGEIQLVRREGEKCYKYRVFTSPGEYSIKCGDQSEDITINHESSSRNINFYYLYNNHSDKLFCN